MRLEDILVLIKNPLESYRKRKAANFTKLMARLEKSFDYCEKNGRYKDAAILAGENGLVTKEFQYYMKAGETHCAQNVALEALDEGITIKLVDEKIYFCGDQRFKVQD